jgi:hypothetical protein
MSILLALALLWCASNLVFVIFMNRRARVRTRRAMRDATRGRPRPSVVS